MVWARTKPNSGFEAFEDRMWDEARAAAERRWRFARATGRNVQLPSAHDEPTLPPGMFRLPPHMRSDRTPTPRISPVQRFEPTQRRRHDDEDVTDEPTQKRRAPTRRAPAVQAPRSRPVPATKWGTHRPSPPPVPASARVIHNRRTPEPAWAPPQQVIPLTTLRAQPAPVEASPRFVMPPPEPAVAPVVVAAPARTPRVLVAFMLGLACSLAWAYRDVRIALDRGVAATEKLSDRLSDAVLSETESRSRLERELAALRSAFDARATAAAAPLPAASSPIVERKRSRPGSAVVHTKLKSPRRVPRVVIPSTPLDDDPLAGVRGTGRRRGSTAPGDLEL